MATRSGRGLRALASSLLLLLLLLPIQIILALAPSGKIGSTTMRTSPTPINSINDIVAGVQSKADEWKSAPLEYKIDLLKQMLSNTIEYQEEWATLAQQSRGVHPTYPLHGCARADILVSSSATFGSYLNTLISTLEHCSENSGAPPPPKAVRSVPGTGKTIATLWPSSLLHRLEAVGLKGELVLGDEGAEQMTYNEACIGGVSAILGAGNFDAPIELMCEMFLKGRVCVYKPNPVNQLQFKALAKILDPLVAAGYLDFVIGGPEEGTALLKHDSLNEVVLTGSVLTYETIKPLTKSKICAELGGVNCWIFVPGAGWSKRSVDNHARHLAFARMSNNGHICAAPQLFLVDRDWEYRQDFLNRLRFWLAEFAGAPPFYPGTKEIYEHFRELPGAEIIHGENVFEGQQRPILFADFKGTGDLLTREAFCPVLAEVPIEGNNDPWTFLTSAVEFAETKAFGSLTCNILIPDEDIRNNQQEFDGLITRLPFGIVGVNFWPVFAHSMPQLVWGAPPACTQSGIGFIGNAGLYRRPVKAVLRAPFNHLGRRALSIMSPQKTEKVFHRLTRYKLCPNPFTQTKLFIALFLGI